MDKQNFVWLRFFRVLRARNRVLGKQKCIIGNFSVNICTYKFDNVTWIAANMAFVKFYRRFNVQNQFPEWNECGERVGKCFLMWKAENLEWTYLYYISSFFIRSISTHLSFITYYFHRIVYIRFFQLQHQYSK